jgi:cytidylate kinase
MNKIIIAIDGHSSCGKSTMAKHLAATLGYIYVDTGAMYRAVTLFAIRENFFSDNNVINEKELKAKMPEIEINFKYNPQKGKGETYLNGENVESEIRLMEVSNHVSAIAALPFIRQAMVEQQRRMGRAKGIVMDGRDIGTTVFPNADLKIFVTASAEVRAKRRYEELKSKGVDADFDEILKNVQERDYIDSHREISPLRKADDAFLLDNSNMTIDEQNKWLEKLAKETIANRFGRIKQNEN